MVRSVRYRFGPDDEDAFFKARDALVAPFEHTPAGQGAGWVASQVLDFKWRYLDGDLTGWDANDVVEILLGLYPAKVMLESNDFASVLRGYADFIRFLGAEGLMANDQAVELGELVEGLEPEFRAAMLDERNWAAGKRLWSKANSEGVDIADPEAVQRFMDDFNALPFRERGAILGPAPGGYAPSFESGPVGPLPPVVLPPAAELRKLAGNTVAFRRLRGLVDYVGDGRALTDRGNLKLADGEQLVGLLETGDRFNERIGDRVYKTKSTTELLGVDLTYRLALATRMLTLAGKKVVPGPNVEWVDDPLAALYGAWIGFFETVGPTQYFYGNDTYGWGWFAEDLDDTIPMILLDLYRHGDTQIEDIADRMWDHLTTIYDLGHVPDEKLDFHQRLVERSLRRAFKHLAELGIVAVSDVTITPTEYAEKASGGVVGLTPLGKWVVRRFGSTITSAPVVGELRDATAHDLLESVSDVSEEEAIAEVDAWIDHHGGDEAARQLVEALPEADETERGLAFRALLRIGPKAGEYVESLTSHPELGPYVTVWRVDTLKAGDDEMDCGGDPERFVRLLDAVIELWGPEAAAHGWAAPAAGADGLLTMLDRVWRLDLPQAGMVLATIGGEHPDLKVAKAARKALFKYRSSGGTNR